MRSFLDFFPPPQFLEMPAVGIDLGEDAVRLIQLGKRGGLTFPKRYVTRPIEQGTIKNGEVINADELSRILRELKQEVRFDFAHVSLPEEKSYIFRTSVPVGDAAQVRDSIEFQLEENVPLSLPEAVFDYSILKQTHHDTTHLDVIVVVLPRRYVHTCTELIKNVGIFPLSLQIAPMALARAIPPPGAGGTYLIAHFFREKTGILVASQGAVQFTSNIGIGSSAFTTSIEKHLGVSTAEAERVKRGEVFLKNKERVELFFSLMNTVSAFKDELIRLFQYWHTFRGRADEVGSKIERVLLCGDDALLSGFDEYLSVMLNTPVEPGNVWRNVFSFDDHIPSLRFEESLNYGTSVGLALAGERHHSYE